MQISPHLTCFSLVCVCVAAAVFTFPILLTRIKNSLSRVQVIYVVVLEYKLFMKIKYGTAKSNCLIILLHSSSFCVWWGQAKPDASPPSPLPIAEHIPAGGCKTHFIRRRFFCAQLARKERPVKALIEPVKFQATGHNACGFFFVRLFFFFPHQVCFPSSRY